MCHLSGCRFVEHKSGGSGFEEQATVLLSAQQGDKTLDLAQAEEIAIECEAEDVREARDDDDQAAFVVRTCHAIT